VAGKQLARPFQRVVMTQAQADIGIVDDFSWRPRKPIVV
jgi:hypothetical protein